VYGHPSAQNRRQVIGTLLNDRFRLEEKIGSGGMGDVYLARDPDLDRPVAVKVMHREMSEQADQLERFRQEARAVAKLSHPNVVAVIDAGEDGGHPYIVFEYIEGETLKQRIGRLGALDVQDALAYAIEIARGICTAHERSMVHRDIKPQNVLIDAEGRAKVTDFGIARQLEQDGVTATGRVLGTTDYVSPEQAMGHVVDPRSDIYSLGVLLYEMLTGDVPFRADSQVGVAMKHVNEELPDVQRRRPEVSAAVARVVERATAKDPAHRYQDVEDMIDDLQTALEVEASRAGQTTGEATSVLEAVPPPKRKLPGRGRTPVAVILLVLGAAAAAVAAVILISGGDVGGGGLPEPASERIGLTEASDFDPEGTGGEHGDDVFFAIDGNPKTTAWTTESYEQPDYGKEGVGLYVETSQPAAATVMQLRTPNADWEFDVYASNDAPEDLEDWVQVASGETAEKSTEVSLDTANNRFRYYLIWSTSPTEFDDGYGASISDVRLFE
jgi:serine/threonine-protein kinase